MTRLMACRVCGERSGKKERSVKSSLANQNGRYFIRLHGGIITIPKSRAAKLAYCQRKRQWQNFIAGGYSPSDGDGDSDDLFCPQCKLKFLRTLSQHAINLVNLKTDEARTQYKYVMILWLSGAACQPTRFVSDCFGSSRRYRLRTLRSRLPTASSHFPVPYKSFIF